jgi:hypothetical protein
MTGVHNARPFVDKLIELQELLDFCTEVTALLKAPDADACNVTIAIPPVPGETRMALVTMPPARVTQLIAALQPIYERELRDQAERLVVKGNQWGNADGRP